MSTNYPTLLHLRGRFVDPHLQNLRPEQPQRLYAIADAFALDDEQAVILAYTHVMLINIRSQEVLWSIACRSSHVMALDRERSILALASKDALAIWNLRNGQLIHNRVHEDDIATDMAFSPDGSLLAVAMYDGGIQLWYVANGQHGHLLNLEIDYGASKSIAFSPDGKYLAAGTYEDNKVWLWNVADGRLQRMMQTHPHAERIHGLTFSPDGMLLVGGDIGGSTAIDQTSVWDVETGRLVQSFDQKTWLPAFSADGKLLASTYIADRDREKNKKAGPFQSSDPICLWDVAGRHLLRQFKGHRERIQGLAFSPSGRTLISCGNDGMVSWWDSESGQEVYRLETCFSTRASGAYTANRRLLVSGLKDGTFRLWHVNEGKLVGAIGAFPGRQGQEGVAINSDGTQIATWTQTPLFSGSLCIWMKGEKRPLQPGNQKRVFSAAFSSHDAVVAVGCDNQEIRIWNITGYKPDLDNTKKPLHTFKQHADDVRCLTFSPDDRFLASGSRDCTICLWDIKKRGAPLHILHGHTQEVTTLAFSPDGKLLASGSEDRNIGIWDVFSGQLLRLVEGHKGTVSCLAFSTDGKHIASGSADGSIRVWKVTDGTSQSVQHDATQAVIERAFALDGKPIESNNFQESVWLWEIPPSVTTYHIQQPHTQITSIAFNVNNILLASGYCDGPTQTWRLEKM
ncbi:MAG TPA: WD40 repeat domain-containing protein [Ktedonobacteraceae bacterium]|jgi:WD40 repeat protein|nr:WD40 repeat domain-containing protein [Ktedonobacteraceae bacterium]